MQVVAQVTAFLQRTPVLNNAVVLRMSEKYDAQSGHVIKTSPLSKKGAHAVNSEMLVLLAYASQYEMRRFDAALNQRKRNAGARMKFTAICTIPCELESMKLFRLRLLQCDQELLQIEMDHRALAICAHVQGKNLRCEQSKQLRSSLVPPINPSPKAKFRIIPSA